MNELGYYAVYTVATGEILRSVMADINSINQGLFTRAGEGAIWAGSEVNNQSHIVINDELTVKVSTVAELKVLKMVEINAAFAIRMSFVKTGVPADEITSWTQQALEADAYNKHQTTIPALLTPAPATPLLDSMVTWRGINKAFLVSKVLQKSALATAYIGKTIGKRQNYEDNLEAIVGNGQAAKDEINAILWVD